MLRQLSLGLSICRNPSLKPLTSNLQIHSPAGPWTTAKGSMSFTPSALQGRTALSFCVVSQNSNHGVSLAEGGKEPPLLKFLC